MEATFRNLRFLVIEDMSTMRMQLRRMIQELGCVNVDMAPSGEEGIERMSTRVYDVVMCDYNLGDGKDGQQVIEEARHRHLLPFSSCFMMITAENSLPMVLGAIEYQPDEYLIKPFVADTLFKRVRRMVMRKEGFRTLDEALRTGNDAEALRLCDTLMNEDPRRTQELIKLKVELNIRQQDLDTASTILDQSLRRRDSLWARFGVGRIKVMQGKFDEAKAILEPFVDQHRHYLEAYDWLASAFEGSGEPERAQKMLEQALGFSNKSVRRQRRLGEVAELNGDLEGAATAYRAAIEQGRNSCFGSAREYTRLAGVVRQQNGSRASLAILRDARRRFRESTNDQVELMVAESDVCRERGSMHESGELLGQAYNLSNEQKSGLPPPLSMELARALLEQGEQQNALNVLAQLARAAHDAPEILDQIRKLSAQHGIAEQAEALVEQACEHMLALNNDGVALFRAARYEEAVAHFTRAWEGLPRNRTINLNTAKILAYKMKLTGPNSRQMELLQKCLEFLRTEESVRDEYTQILRIYRSLLAIQAERNKATQGAEAVG